MTVTERPAGEFDKILWHRNNRCTREQLFPWRAEHEVGHCNWGSVFYTRAEAEHALATHQCKQTYQRMNGMSIAEQYWVELDRVIDKIKKGGRNADPEAYHKLQGRAGGLAYCIVKACEPYYDAEVDVSKEALRRWKMRNGKMDWEPTPGYQYNPQPAHEHARATLGHDAPATYTQPHNRGTAPVAAPVSGRRRRAGAATPVEKQLSELEKETIRKTGGAFPSADLAKMYGVSEATIRSLIT